MNEKTKVMLDELASELDTMVHMCEDAVFNPQDWTKDDTHFLPGPVIRAAEKLLNATIHTLRKEDEYENLRFVLSVFDISQPVLSGKAVNECTEAELAAQYHFFEGLLHNLAKVDFEEVLDECQSIWHEIALCYHNGDFKPEPEMPTYPVKEVA